MTVKHTYIINGTNVQTIFTPEQSKINGTPQRKLCQVILCLVIQKNYNYYELVMFNLKIQMGMKCLLLDWLVDSM